MQQVQEEEVIDAKLSLVLVGIPFRFPPEVGISLPFFCLATGPQELWGNTQVFAELSLPLRGITLKQGVLESLDTVQQLRYNFKEPFPTSLRIGLPRFKRLFLFQIISKSG